MTAAGEATSTATIERFGADVAPADLCAAVERDGAAIVEHLLPMDIVGRVNAEVEAAVAAADPDEELFNPLLQAFHGAQTKQVAGVPGISRTFATDVMCHPLLLALCDHILLPVLRALPAQPRPSPPAGTGHGRAAGCTATRRSGATSRPRTPSCSSLGDRVRRLHP